LFELNLVLLSFVEFPNFSTKFTRTLPSQPGATVKQLVEGKEVSAFWQNLGGKGDYPQAKESKEVGKDPRLFLVSSASGVA
jgi:hypothetical protein